MPLKDLRTLIIKDFQTDRTQSFNDLKSIQEISRKNWNITSEESKFSKTHLFHGVFENPKNIHDLYIDSYDPISISNIYYRFFKPLEYSAGFHLHFEAVDTTSTKVSIYTYDSSVLYWGMPLPSGDHAFVKEKDVAPTTIEEYEILMRIGNLVGVKDMPPLKLPKQKNIE